MICVSRCSAVSRCSVVPLLRVMCLLTACHLIGACLRARLPPYAPTRTQPRTWSRAAQRDPTIAACWIRSTCAPSSTGRVPPPRQTMTVRQCHVVLSLFHPVQFATPPPQKHIRGVHAPPKTTTTTTTTICTRSQSRKPTFMRPSTHPRITHTHTHLSYFTSQHTHIHLYTYPTSQRPSPGPRNMHTGCRQGLQAQW